MTEIQKRILMVLGSIVGVTAVLTIVVLNLGGADASDSSAARPQTGGQRQPTTTVEPTPDRPAVRVRATDVVNVRSGPGLDYEVVAQLQPEDEAPATGRNRDGSWLLLDLPAAGNSDAWVSAGVVEIEGDVRSLPVRNGDTDPTPEEGDRAEDQEHEGADLFIGSVTLNANGYVQITIGNGGPGAASGSILLRIEPEGTEAHEETVTIDLRPGEFQSFTTGYQVEAPTTALITIDAGHSVDTVQQANNSTRQELLKE